MINKIGSLVCGFFTKTPVENFEQATSSDTELYKKYFLKMLENGINLAPAQFEAMFVSYAHTVEDINKTVEASYKALKQLKEEGAF
ncbi:MAG: hypothetical protein ACRCW1_02835 [Anaerotignaceae bacterium]